jgi:ribokinase
MLAGVDIFLPSEVEVNRLLGHQDLEQAAREFADYGCKIVVIKLGANGSLIYDRETEKFWNIPVFQTTVIDVTGAGDAYSGGFMAMYVMNGDLLKAGLAGSVSASFAIEDFGMMHMAIQDRNKAYQRLNQLLANHHPRVS